MAHFPRHATRPQEDLQMTRMHVTSLLSACIGVLSAVLLLLLGAVGFIASTAVSEDSWRHFTRGGTFYTTPPSISPNFSRVVFATTARGHGDIGLRDIDASQSAYQGDSELVETSPHFVDGGTTFAFLREVRGCRHLWLTDTRASTTTQVTTGSEWDYILDADTTQKRLLILKGDAHGGGYGRGGEAWCIELAGSKRQWCVGQFALFTKAGIVFSDIDDHSNIYLLDDETGKKRLLGTARLVGVSQQRESVIAGTEEYDATAAINTLQAYSIRTRGWRKLGAGQSVVLFKDGSAILSQGFGGQLVLRDLAGNERVVEAPPGQKQLYEHADSGAALLYTREGNATCGAVWRFNAKTNRFDQIVKIP